MTRKRIGSATSSPRWTRSGPARVALVNEQLAELDYLAQRWERVPRVCASISTSFGFLLAFATVASMARRATWISRSPP